MNSNAVASEQASNTAWWLETLLLFLLCYLKAGSLPPDVNEAHYLTKARHYWNPVWCPHDFFLDSADAHTVFYWTFGWVCALVSLPVAAWIGRVAIWLLLSWSWQRLSFALVPVRMAAVLSGGLMIVLTTVGHMAGEWIVGGVEAKGFAYVFLFLGMEQIVRNRWTPAWLLLGAAAAMHVLVGGWGVVAAMFAWLAAGRERPKLASMLPGLAGGFCLSLLGLIPAFLLNRGVDAETIARANWIYVMIRLPHHLVFNQFDHWFMARHGALALLLAALVGWQWTRIPNGKLRGRLRRLAGFIGGTAILSIVGIIIDQATLYHDDLAASLLRLYWYRLGDMLIPGGVALLIVLVLWQVSLRRPRLAQCGTGLAVVAAVTPLLYWSYQQQRQLLPGAATGLAAVRDGGRELAAVKAEYEDWKNACAWIAKHAPEEAVFLTPRWQQTFKWHAERGEVVAVKDVPQDARGLIEWNRRRERVLSPGVSLYGYAVYTDAHLMAIANQYGASYVIFEPRKFSRATKLMRVYPIGEDWNASYSIYRIGK
jgi:hypothetical protein